MDDCIPMEALGTLDASDESQRRHLERCARCSAMVVAYREFMRAEAPKAARVREADAREAWGGAIRARIERNKRYPRSAGGASGVATVQLTITRSGQLAALSLQGSSGNPLLDQAALEAVRAVGRFPAAPAAITAPSMNFNLRINFSR